MSIYLNKFGLFQFWQNVKEKITGKHCLYNNYRYFVWKNSSDYTTSVFPINLTKSCLGYKRLDIEVVTNDHRRFTFTLFDPQPGQCFILHDVYLASEVSSDSWTYFKNISCKISNDGMSIVEAQYSGERNRGDATTASGFNHYYLLYPTIIIGYTHY